MRRLLKSIMSKRQHAEYTMDNNINLDRELRPQKVQRVAGASDKIPTDPENEMDNWKLSAEALREQRNSKEPRDLRAWEARRVLHPIPRGKFEMHWQYSRKSVMRKWTVRRGDQHKLTLSRKTSGLTLNEQSPSSLPTEFGDFEISEIYWSSWIYGEKQEFLDELYKKYGLNGAIPEQIIWKIFACLVSELVREDQVWPEAPTYIVASPNTIWQVGKCMFNILTRGRFWDEDFNVLNAVDNGEKFGVFKQESLQVTYSKSLMKFVLGCLSAKEYERFTRKDLMEHFEKVRAIYAGDYVPEPIPDPRDGPYEPSDPRIPKGLTQAEGEFYEGLIHIHENRKAQEKKDGIDTKPHIVTITDLAKDYDDLMAMMCLKEFDRMGIIQLEGFVANLMPAERRALFGKGALESLGLPNIPVGIGSVGDAERKLNNYLHEFDNTERFIAPDSTKLPEGQELLTKIFTERPTQKKKLTILTISSLMDIAQFSRGHSELLKKGVANVVLQGGYRMMNGKLTADPAAANNRFDLEGADTFHTFMQENKIPSTAWTKVAAGATPIYQSLFEFLHDTGHPLGLYLRAVQTSQELNFYERCCSDKPFAPHMTQDWAVKTKSTWFAAGHEPDEPYPLGEAMLPYFTKVIGYDALAVVGASGEDVLKHFGIVKPLQKRLDADDPLHKLVGIPKTDGAGDEDGLPEENNLDGQMMGVAISALMKGSILAYQQGLPQNASKS